MRFSAIAIAVPCLFLLPGNAGAQNFSARVTDQAGQPLSGVTVELLGTPVAMETDANGEAGIGEPTVIAASGGRARGFRIEGNALRFRLERPASFSGEFLDAKGTAVATLPNRVLLTGPQNVALPAPGTAAGKYWLALKVGGNRIVLPAVRTGSGWTLNGGPGTEKASPARAGIAARISGKSAAGDSLRFSKDGFETEAAPVPEPGGEVEVELAKGLDFTHLFTGTGRILDLATGLELGLPLAKRIHVVIFPEGYTQADIDAGLFKKDSEEWMKNLFRIDPVGALKEAFVLWRFPIASPSRFKKSDLDQMDGPRNTYFQFRLFEAEDGPEVSLDLAAAASQVFTFLEKNTDLPMQAWPREDGLLHSERISNTIGVFLIKDRNEDDPRDFVGVYSLFMRQTTFTYMDMAIGRHHGRNFMQALAFLGTGTKGRNDRDPGEYQMTRPGLSGLTTNLYPVADCDKLPWKHLLKGGANDPGTDSVVGAYGPVGRYRPEYRDMMNGSPYKPASAENPFDGSWLGNWSRELVALRIYERTGILPDPKTSLAQWEKSMRGPFYQKFGFKTPPKASEDKGFHAGCAEAAPGPVMAGP
jgi:hypothetical protein